MNMNKPKIKLRYILACPEFEKSKDVLGNKTYDRHGVEIHSYETFEAALYGALHYMCNKAIMINSLNIHATIYSIEDDYNHEMVLGLDFLDVYEEYISFLKTLSGYPGENSYFVKYTSLPLAIFFLLIDSDEWNEDAKEDMDKCVAHNKATYYGGEIGKETNSSGFPFDLVEKELKAKYANWRIRYHKSSI